MLLHGSEPRTLRDVRGLSIPNARCPALGTWRWRAQNRRSCPGAAAAGHTCETKLTATERVPCAHACTQLTHARARLKYARFSWLAVASRGTPRISYKVCARGGARAVTQGSRVYVAGGCTYPHHTLLPNASRTACAMATVASAESGSHVLCLVSRAIPARPHCVFCDER